MEKKIKQNKKELGKKRQEGERQEEKVFKRSEVTERMPE